MHKFDLSCHSNGPRRFPKLKIRTQLIFNITSTWFIFPLVSQEILEGDIMSAKMSHPAGKILWLIREGFWGDPVQKMCWKYTFVQKGIEQFHLLSRYTVLETHGSETWHLMRLLWVEDLRHRDEKCMTIFPPILYVTKNKEMSTENPMCKAVFIA